ncbi:MAG TPA: DUF418 domain-containing protein [Burkholderiaceae bacterium]|nr:DUF418 domain-containing protein [Burkholderiaceae bacterium]
MVGILQVNIQSFVWGAGDPLGYFLTVPSAVDAALHVLIGTFVSTKFISIFAFLFGLGAALQFRSIARRVAHSHPGPGVGENAALTAAQAVYRRRLRFLLAVGVAHGLLLYHGDILAFYALCGFVLVRFLPQRPAAILRATIVCWILAALLMVAAAVFAEAARPWLADDPHMVPPEALRAFEIYVEGSYLEQLPQRFADYTSVLFSLAVVSVPHVLGLFLLGVLAARLGWLTRPQRHVRLWQAATWIGTAAVPVAAYGAWLNFETMAREPGAPSAIGYTLQFFGSALACLYVAALVRLRATPPVAAAIRWLAPAGRMPLTNYLLQSLVMGALLSGWGFGLGDALTRAELAALALAIVAAQLAASRAWIARFGQGPLEAWWRRVTYAGTGA